MTDQTQTTTEQIQWLQTPPPQDGSTVYGHSWSPYRWTPYSPKSEQAKRGIKGRWQTMNEFGGWVNAPPPNEWATQEQISARQSTTPQPLAIGLDREAVARVIDPFFGKSAPDNTAAQNIDKKTLKKADAILALSAPAEVVVSAEDVEALKQIIDIEYYSGSDAWAGALERLLTAYLPAAPTGEGE